MNHHYPDSYRGYGHTTPGMSGMPYGGGYGDASTMARMGHPREGYQMSHYQMMPQSGGMYSQGGFVTHQGGNPYNMGNFSNFGMPGMNQPLVMSSRQADLGGMSGGSMVNPYYSSGVSSDAHISHHGGMNSQSSTYSHGPPNPHLQQPHMDIMTSQSHQTMPSQALQPSMTGQSLHGQGGQLAHGTSHSGPQVGPLPSAGAYRGQNSPHMMPRTHHVPQHPMRHPATQQNPQEVADNILQMASSYPSNQTVQVPLKSRPAPYHIPRSPHYNMSHTDHAHTSPNPHLQPSPAASCQASPSPSSSSVKSPTPVLAPIPNPIPSPGISGLRSPCNQGMSPCGTQRSPAHLGSSYSGHSQGGPPAQCSSDGLSLHHGMSPSDSQHYSPCGMAPAHNFSPFCASPTVQRNSMYSPSCDSGGISNAEQLHQPNYSGPTSSPCSNNLSSYVGTSKLSMGLSSNTNMTISSLHMGSNPLMSLQKLVMLPETQVVDPKSVVNDTCLSSQQDESPKNVNGPAEWLAESSGHSVGFQDQSSSLRGLQQSKSQAVQSQNTGGMTCYGTPVNNLHTSQSSSPEQKQSSTTGDTNGKPACELSEISQHDIIAQSGHEFTSHSSCIGPMQHSGNMNSKSECELSEVAQYDSIAQSGHEFTSHSSSIKPVEHSGGEIKSAEATPVETDSVYHLDQRQQEPESNNTANISTFVTHDNAGSVAEESKGEFPDPDKDAAKQFFISTSKAVTEDRFTDSKTVKVEISEKTSDDGNPISLISLERKNGRVKDDTKCLIVQCRSPNVLSEMPVTSNGLSSTPCSNEDDPDQDCGNGVHTRIQNAFSSLVKAKLARVKRVSQFASVTPCSIAVGADERAACERLAIRRNGFCRTLRTSRIICNGRNRNDSTGNCDSDESLENISEASFGLSESPQDGNRKRPASTAKRSDHKKPGLSTSSVHREAANNKSKSVEPMTSSSNGCVSYGDVVSDDDTYYEGVDSSDIFINNFSSDESVTSNGEVKQNSLVKGTVEKANENSPLIPPVPDIEFKEKSEKKTDGAKTELVSPGSDNKYSPSTTSPPSPLSKRLRRLTGQKIHENLRALSVSRRSFLSNKDDAAEIIDLTCDSEQQASAVPSNSKLDTYNSANRAAKVQMRGSNKFRPLILGHRPVGKYPVVILEKSSVSPARSPGVKKEQFDHEHVDLEKSSDPLRGSGTFVDSAVCGNDKTVYGAEKCGQKFRSENVALGSDLIKEDIEENEMKDIEPNSSTEVISPKIKHRRRPAKRRMVRSKHKTKIPGKVNRHDEVRDSFKSMKFSRTLDLMKSRRRREQVSTGPFIRLIGKQSAPDLVTVFTQPISESSSAQSSGKHKHLRSKNTCSLTAATTIRMVTSLPTDKVAMVSSSRTISHDPWVCAFCDQQSSYRFLGDLYGPYYKEDEISMVESIALEEAKKSDAVREQKFSDSSLARKAKEHVSVERKNVRKVRSPLQTRSSKPQPPEEVWVHEACAMWSPGVYLIGNKIYGLDEAIKDVSETVCSVCKSKGAMIGCLHKGCCMKYHYVCAIDKDCYMDEEKLSLLCPKHKDKKLKSTAELERS